ncbi:MAG TPA: hypothetical protein VJQ59_16980 [Candidatus Sulfotelmatobacter sp.]|nr:hypothetical protein [Candidatus Sulfotelmatobacter sp.]
MYSPKIIEANLDRIQKGTRKKYTRYSREESVGRSQQLELKRGNGKAFSDEDRTFMENEQVLSQIDFRYFCERYAYINIDASMGGGIGPLVLWEPQEWLVQKLAAKEEEMYEQKARNEPIDGIMVVSNKIRQIGFTAIWRAITWHRLITGNHLRAFGVSLDDDLKHELYERDRFIYDNLPFFLKPEVVFDVKDEHISLENNSRIIYDASTKKGALGISRQFEITHLTEVSQWERWATNRIQLDLLPGIPQSLSTVFGMEAVPAGRGNFWHEFSEDVRMGKYPRWIYTFIPWYAEPRKYRRTPPVGWQPSEASMAHAYKISETSSLYTRWSNYMVPKDNLYWWETTREEFRLSGNLNFFLTNFAANPEESFQHAGRSAFPTEYLEWARNQTVDGTAYEIAGPSGN